MLKVTIPGTDGWDQENEVFVVTKSCVLTLEHSLVSLSKWEEKWEKPFLSNKGMSNAESADYIRCMTITQNVPPEVYLNIPADVVDQIVKYIDRPMTATTFAEDHSPPSRQIVTAEVIYGWMVALNIPFECQKWHLNKLFTLIKVCNINNSPRKKRSGREILSRNRSLNAARKARYNTNG